MTIFAITLLPIAMLLVLTLAVVSALWIQARRVRVAPSKVAAARDVYRT